MSRGSSRQLLQEGKKKQLVPCSKERYSFWTFSHQEPRRITRFDVRPQSLVLHHYNLQVRPLEAASPVAVLPHPLLLNRHQPLSITENHLAVQCQRILLGPHGASLHFWMGGEQREVHASAPTRCLPSQLYSVTWDCDTSCQSGIFLSIKSSLETPIACA